MRRHRLTFDANPKELASRDAGCTHVLLPWSRRTGRAAVVIEDDATGDVVEMDARERDNPLDVFDHPFVYAPARGHPGRAWSTHVGGPIAAA
jgi:hypothetical protein